MSALISRQAAIEAVVDLPNCYNGYSDTYDKACIIGLLEELPPAQPERKPGKWLKAGTYHGEQMFECSECNGRIPVPTVYAVPAWGWCPDCGADMRGEQDAT